MTVPFPKVIVRTRFSTDNHILSHPKKKKSMAKYEKRLVLGYDRDGKQIRKRIYANSQAELDRNIHKALSDFEQAPNPSDITFKKYADKWMSAYKDSREAATKAMYKNAINRMEDIWYMKLSDIRQTDLQQIIQDNVDHPSVCAKIRLTMRQIWLCAVEDGILPKDITKRLELPILSVKQGRALYDAEKDAIRDAHLNPMDRMFVSLLFYFGLRPQEALALRKEDFTKDSVTIKRAIGYDGNNPYLKETKTRNIRTLPIPTQFKGLLKTYQIDGLLIHRDGNPLTKTMQVKMWARIKKEITRQLIIQNAKSKMGWEELLQGADLTEDQVQSFELYFLKKRFNKVITLDEVETDLHPYVFRHNYATRCFYSHISLKKCQYLLGHSSIQMIMKVYAHLEDEEEAVNELCKIAL